MTDNEIIKALNNMTYGGHYCAKCKYDNGKGDDRCGLKGCKIARYALDLIKRQKAENDSLKVDLAKCSIRLDNLYKTADEIKFEAIKEFAEKLKRTITNAINNYYNSNAGGYYLAEDVIEDIDNLVKEMTEVN